MRWAGGQRKVEAGGEGSGERESEKRNGKRREGGKRNEKRIFSSSTAFVLPGIPKIAGTAVFTGLRATVSIAE
jgi:hypothetical protein